MSDPVYKMIRRLFELADDYPLEDRMGPGDIPNWDSLGNINMINEIQEIYGVDFSLEELAEITDISSLKSILKEKGINGFD